MTWNVAAQASDLSSASHHAARPAAHHSPGDGGRSSHRSTHVPTEPATRPPAPHHLAGCGEGRPAVARVSDLLPLSGSSIPVATGAGPTHALAVADTPVPIPPPAVRRALLQVFRI